MPDFCHLHSHTQYSLLDGAADIERIMSKASEDEMKAVAITDHGNMFGVMKFYNEAVKQGIKPIIGCEFYVVEDRFQKKFDRVNRDKRYHQLILAKNEQGYRNISKLCSFGFTEGLYSKYPRIDKELLKQYSEGLIGTTCCAAAEVPNTFLVKGEEEAEKAFLEWHEIFGDDYYIELQRQELKEFDQEGLNDFLIRLSKKYNVKIIATNDSHYVDQADYESHDILLCIETGSDYDDPNRFRFENNQFYFKTKSEMSDVFKDFPEALENTVAIADGIVTPELKRDILLPNYTLPDKFTSEDDFLKHITYQGAGKRYGEIGADLQQRLDYELGVIRDMGFAGYFLIVQDFIAAAKELGVAVGPGRGSAAGSVIAYVTGITNLDPIKYNLLFERFLNPERISMPDIDIDFDDEGRQKVIDYVVNKYGRNQVAQIVTFGTMAARSAIRDVGRVLKLPLSDTDRLAKMVPEMPGITLQKAYSENPDLNKARQTEGMLPVKTLELAERLEGSVRHRGIHAAGVIIAPNDLTEYIPVCTAKDTDLLVTQFDGRIIEDAGMLKMDFLGLKTLSIINDAIINIEKNRGITLTADEIPLDDEITFNLYKKGATIGTFQFESEGMRTYLKDLKPSNIEDLIAMNALYRPGPMDYIPEFIDRKHGRKKVKYPHEWLEEILENTYGIMVYQEQIMQCAQVMAGFTLGAADILRRAMGKKKLDVMEQQRQIFIEGAGQKGIEKKQAETIFAIMEKFAKYGFNRSHSAAYSILAYQTGYLKANFPAEYMAAVLTHNMNDVKQVNYFLHETHRMNISTKGPDINESEGKFTVNKEGVIRFGLSAIKGIGEASVSAMVEERNANGPFHNIFDLTKRVNLRAVNKKCMESLACAGAFDSFGYKRSQYFHIIPGENINALEKAIKYGNQYQSRISAAQSSLFGESAMMETVQPPIPECEPWPLIELLQNEKEVTGMYIYGHPLDDYKMELSTFCNTKVTEIEGAKEKDIRMAGIVTSVVHRVDKKGRKYGRFVIEDYSGSATFTLFAEDYLKFKHFLGEGYILYIKGRNQLRFKSEDQFEFRIHQIELLSEIRDKYTKVIELNVDINDINEGLIDDLESLLKSHNGKCLLKINVIDREEKYKIGFSAKRLKVDISNELLDELSKIPHLTYKLN